MKTTTRMILATLLALAASAGCDGPGPKGPAADAALAGQWKLTDPGSGQVLNQWTFNGDGSFVYEIFATGAQSADRVTGTYRTAGGRLVIDQTREKDPRRRRLETPYNVNADRLVLGAISPAGPHQGLIGAWSISVTTADLDASGQPLDARDLTGGYTFAGDGKLTANLRLKDQEPVEIAGTYVEEAPAQYRLTLPAPNGGTMNQTLFLIEDSILTAGLLRR